MVVLLEAQRVLRRGFAPFLDEPFRPQDTLSALAGMMGLLLSFLFAALHAVGQLPPHLQDPRGGPCSLYAPAATIVAVRLLAVGSPSGSVPRRLLGASALALCGVGVLSMSMVLPWAIDGGGIATFTATLMAILVATSPESLRVLSSCRRTSTEALGRILGKSNRPSEVESAAGICKVIFARQGVLTEGCPQIQAVHVLREGAKRDDILHLAAVAEYGIAHPIRDAILRDYRSRFRTIARIKEVDFVEGRGVRAQHQGKELLLGNLQLFRETGWLPHVLKLMEDKVKAWSTRGETVLFVALGGELTGALCFLDPLRQDAAETLAGLRRLGVRVTVASGDAPESVTALCQSLGEVEVRAGLAPRQRNELLAGKRRGAEGCAVVRKHPSDETQEHAFCIQWRARRGGSLSAEPLEVVLRGDRLHSVVAFLSAARRLRRSARRGLGAIVIHHCLLLPLLAGALYPWIGLKPVPVLAALASVFLPRVVAVFFRTTREDSGIA